MVNRVTATTRSERESALMLVSRASKLKVPTNPAGHPVASGVKVKVVELGSKVTNLFTFTSTPVPKVGSKRPSGR